MEEFLGTLSSISDQPVELLKNLTFEEEKGQGRTIPSTIDVAFADPISWLMTQVAEQCISRDTLVKKFVNWIKSLWKSRPRCKMIILLAERSRFVPICRHAEGQDTIKEHCSTLPIDPLPYMWDDENLGGPQGFQAWICKAQGRTECLRTLMADLQEYPDRQDLTPFPDKPLIVDCDLPYGVFAFWKGEPNVVKFQDPRLPGCTGESIMGLKAYIELIDKEPIDSIFGIRSYELISEDPEWGLMGLHMSYLLQGARFKPVIVSRSLDPNWKKNARIWLKTENKWFSLDGWYALLKAGNATIYEPWCHFLALYKLYKNPLLGGTNFAYGGFGQLWDFFVDWSKKRSLIPGTSGTAILGNGLFLFVNPVTRHLIFKRESFLSFASHIFNEQDTALPDNEITRQVTGQVIVQWFKTSLVEISRRLAEYIEIDGWKVVLEKHCSEPNPLTLLKQTPEKRRELADRLLKYIRENPDQWEKTGILENVLLAIGIEDPYKREILTEYETNVNTQIGSKMQSFRTILNQSTFQDFPTQLESVFPSSGQITGPLKLHIEQGPIKNFVYALVDAEGRLENAWKNTIWNVVYMTMGDNPYFIDRNWYGPVTEWGFLVNGRPSPKKVPYVLDNHYRTLDLSRSNDTAQDSKYYQWNDNYGTFYPHELFTKMTFSPEKYVDLAPNLCRVFWEEQSGFLVFKTNVQPSFLQIGSVIGNKKMALDFDIKKDLWNAYMLRIGRIHFLPSSGKYPDCGTFMLSRILNVLSEYMSQEGSAKYIPELGSDNLVKETFRIANILLDFIINSSRSIPWFAETWLRELFDRSFSFAYFKTKYVGSDKSKERIYESALNEAATCPSVQNYALKGTFGLLLDHFFLICFGEMTLKKFHFGKMVAFKTDDYFCIPTRRLKSGSERAITGSTGLEQGLKSSGVKFPWIKANAEVRQVRNPDDALIFECVTVKQGGLIDFKNPVHVQQIFEFFCNVIAYRAVNYKPIDPISWETTWLTTFIVSGKKTKPWFVFPYIINTNTKIDFMDPFRLLYLGTLRTETALYDIHLNHEDLCKRDKIIEQTIQLTTIFRTEPKLKDGTQFYYGYRSKRDVGRLQNMYWDIYVSPDHLPMPGTVYGLVGGIVKIILFFSLLWSNQERREAVLKNLGYQPADLSLELLTGLDAAKTFYAQ